MSSVIGIDLGTTYCCAAIYEDGDVQIIETKSGKNSTPSRVVFKDDGTVRAGSYGIYNYYSSSNLANCLYDIKRLVGRKYDDPVVQADKTLWSFEVVDDGKNSPVIKLTNGRTFYPEQISAKLLSFLKVKAEKFLYEEITQAVITVPAYFNDGQRQATKDAAEIAGLDVFRIINEPTAAAIAYYHQNRKLDGKTILVFDIGGGTFDVSILKINGSELKIIGVGGDTHLGGEDFDNSLVEYCVEEFKKKEGVDLKENFNSEDIAKRINAKNQIRRLKLGCEEIKIALSTSRKRAVSLEAMFKDKHLHVEITREKFESLNKHYFDKCFNILSKVIRDASLSVQQIDDVILVGGSSNIPAIQTRVKEFFGGKDLHHKIRGCEAVAYGAVIVAAGIINIRETLIYPLRLHNYSQTGVEITKANYLDFLSKIFANSVEGILLKNVTHKKITYFTDRTTRPGYLGLKLLENGLIHHTELEELDAEKVPFKQCHFLYMKILNKKIESKRDYEGLLISLFDSGNEHIGKVLMELLEESLPPKVTESNVRLTRAQIEHMRKEEIIQAHCSVIGIDLGTTYCCAAIYEDGEVKIIETQAGENITPSNVAFEDDGTVWAGSEAKADSSLNPANCLYAIKRLIGRKHNDPVVQADKTLWPFEVVGDGKNSPLIKLTNGQTFCPEQISAKLLSYLKVQSEIFLSEKVTKAVITVPAYFNDGQRQATKDAAEIAGLEVLRIINEPTAAAIAYYHMNRNLNGKTIVVFDLGGGTFDVSILKINESELKVLGVGGDTHLGGEDFDNSLVEYCVEEFKKKEGVDLKVNLNSEDNAIRMNAKNKIHRLKLGCEEIKIALSTSRKRAVSLEAMFEEQNLHVEITREEFETLNKHYFDRCISILEKVIKDAKLTVQQIEEVVLVGGSSKIPAIQTRVIDFFGGKKPHRHIKGSEAVAYGAAILAQIMSPNKDPKFDMWIKDVCPLSVGVKITPSKSCPDTFSPILKKNTIIPCSNTKDYYTTKANITEQVISIYEGESMSATNNHFLGSFEVTGLPKNCPKSEIIKVTMALTAEGILHCTAVFPRNAASNTLKVIETKGRLTRAEIRRMRKEEKISAQTFE